MVTDPVNDARTAIGPVEPTPDALTLDAELDLRVPGAALVFAPVLLALFTLLLSLSNWSVFLGFEEDEPGTWMSLSLMFATLLLVLPAIRNRALEPAYRRAAALLSLVIGGALLDERLEWHEGIGMWIRGVVGEAEHPMIVYADDVIIILLAIVGALVMRNILRSLPDVRGYIPYVALIVVLAGAHGVLDLLGHRPLIWQIFWPEMTNYALRPLREILGFFEESTKLWTEYFVVLFLLRFFYRQTGHLAWTVLVMTGSWMATAGLWSVVNEPFVPYVIMGTVLRFVRNYPMFLLLAGLWVPWTIVVWRWFSDDPEKTAFAGLFFLWPLVQAPPWLLLVYGCGLGLPLRDGRRPKPRAQGAIIAALLVTFALAMGLSGRGYLT
ncbi:MAG TPA: hypothetical protein EYQ27_10425, partial [Gemmatimonadetes bacterium]|nr:hypothetical protein [Gemmatimonadota bacterium]